jgi:tetratricopeptide (TPR) repeat protein
VERDPAYAAAWVGLGSALDLKGEFLSLPELSQRAIEALRRAIAIDPGLAIAHSRLGSAYLNLRRYEEALAEVGEAVRLDPALPGARSMLGRIHWFGLGQFEEGIRELEMAASLNVEAGYAFLQLSLLYSLTRDYRKAEIAARRAIDLQERYVSGKEGLQIVGAHLRLGYALYRQGRHDEAIHEYERELSFVSSGEHALGERTLIEAHQKLSAAHWRKGDREAADREFDRARLRFVARLASGADDGATKYYMAAMHALRGDVGPARRYLAEALQQLPGLNRARARVDPDFDPVRDDPEVRALLAE